MDLRTYLYVNHIKIKDFAQLLGKSNSFLSQIINKHKIPSVPLALDIEKHTEGRLKAKDLIRDAFEVYLDKVFKDKNGPSKKQSPNKKKTRSTSQHKALHDE